MSKANLQRKPLSWQPPKAPVPSTIHGRASKSAKLCSRKVHSRSQSHPTNGSGSSSRASSRVRDDDEYGGVAGLPQFCATCEKQIVTPGGGSILYCSEACRKQDGFTMPISDPTQSTWLLATKPSPDSAPTNDIIPPRSPTVLKPLSFYDSDDDGPASDDSDDEGTHLSPYNSYSSISDVDLPARAYPLSVSYSFSPAAAAAAAHVGAPSSRQQSRQHRRVYPSMSLSSPTHGGPVRVIHGWTSSGHTTAAPDSPLTAQDRRSGRGSDARKRS